MSPWLFFGRSSFLELPSRVLSLSSQSIVSILLAQVAASVVVAGTGALLYGQTVAVSALLGGGIAVVPNAFLAARLMSPRLADDAQAMLRAAWLGELGKLVLTGLLFAAVFVSVKPLSGLALFAGFITAQMMIFGAPLIERAGTDKGNGTTRS